MINFALRMCAILLCLITGSGRTRVYLQNNSSVNVSGISFTVNTKSTFYPSQNFLCIRLNF